MSEETALEKARGAVAGAKHLLDTAEPDEHGLLKRADLEEWSRLMRAAEVQALISQAESLEKATCYVPTTATAIARLQGGYL